MSESNESSDAPVDTHNSILGAIDRVLGPEISDESQVSGLKGLSLKGAFSGDLRPHSLRRRPLREREKTQKGKRKGRPINKARRAPNRAA